MEQFDRGHSDIFSMEVDDVAKSSFLEMARWTKFLAILGFIFLGLMLIGCVFFGVAVSNMPIYGSMLGGSNATGIMIVYFVIIAGINFYPIYALLKYSTSIRTALAANDKTKFNEAIGYLKSMFKYIGILMIIILAIYGLIFIIALLAALGR